MEDVKLAIIYYSSNGTNYQLAKWASVGAQAVGAEVKILKVHPRDSLEVLFLRIKVIFIHT